ncbi:hypothetical protein LZV00_11135 [Pseudomonas kielensis]|uniref:hypothetical protein n=1 Tax=Pseudomonas kielensis TaxID=2762577 RepID=UPI00223F78AE|nr:hypothetical protein [Pseudomonas kielensis]UZM16219.1 hypothetical protein LZV00_11135 [Pseudomonas kielensis]
MSDVDYADKASENASKKADVTGEQEELNSGRDAQSVQRPAPAAIPPLPEAFFSYLAKEHLHEAQEFRRKRHNSQVPKVDPSLLAQLKATVAASEDFVRRHAKEEGRLSQSWLLGQINELKEFIGELSGNTLEVWVGNEVVSTCTAEEGADKLGSRAAAQSLARRLESTLQALIRVANVVGSVVDYSTPENLQRAVKKELTSEVIDAIALHDKQTVAKALEKMTADAADNVTWSELVSARVTAKEADRPAALEAVITATRREAEKANKKARMLSGDAQAFFGKTAEFLQKFSRELGGRHRQGSPLFLR